MKKIAILLILLPVTSIADTYSCKATATTTGTWSYGETFKQTEYFAKNTRIGLTIGSDVGTYAMITKDDQPGSPSSSEIINLFPSHGRPTSALYFIGPYQGINYEVGQCILEWAGTTPTTRAVASRFPFTVTGDGNCTARDPGGTYVYWGYFFGQINITPQKAVTLNTITSPNNPYLSHTLTINLTPPQSQSRLEASSDNADIKINETSVTTKTLTTPMTAQYVCTNLSTKNVALRVDTGNIDFGNLTIGATQSHTVDRNLTWSLEGPSGPWMMRFDSPTATNDGILLGSTKIDILNGDGDRMLAGTTYPVMSQTGTITLRAGNPPPQTQPGVETTMMTITVTAN
ncbi:TPA: hypothetical protein ACY3HI_004741 [Citrobacter braakii]